MPGPPFVVVLSEEEIAALADAAVQDLAQRLAHRAFRPLSAESSHPDELAESDALAHLHALTHVRRAVIRQENAAAERAVLAGADYPKLGQATNISRQGARRRWPGLVTAAKTSRQPSDETDS
ncbi:hypothetical protein GCM10009839_01830 [Catenulispora yoronensis]|uniref:Uncharacterized protein n=1 Tax=Catenulispora yoronensis TaxID=450799 RepID=A0ABP5F2W9_9ACTN